MSKVDVFDAPLVKILANQLIGEFRSLSFF